MQFQVHRGIALHFQNVVVDDEMTEFLNRPDAAQLQNTAISHRLHATYGGGATNHNLLTYTAAANRMWREENGLARDLLDDFQGIEVGARVRVVGMSEVEGTVVRIRGRRARWSTPR